MTKSVLLYGANGYTGRIIAELAESYGLSPVLAGRNEPVMRQMSEQYQLPYRISSLENAAGIDELLQDITVVIHAAGPFSTTAKPMIEACIRNKVHYLDITGEIPVFELAKKYHTAALEAGIMVMPGTGFDVVPTDCMALSLKEKMPDATHLELAFTNLGGGLSHGTATTMAQSLGEPGVIRENGKMTRSLIGAKHRLIDFGKGPWMVMSIPWGDISTAYHTTGIPNIITYTGITNSMYRVVRLQVLFNWILRTNWVRRQAIEYINRKPAGPSAEDRKKGVSLVWGEVSNAAGEKQSSRLRGPDGYTLTAHSSLIITKKVLEGNYKPGYQTPAGCYGSKLVMEVPGTEQF